LGFFAAIPNKPFIMEITMEQNNQDFPLIIEIDAGAEIGDDELDLQTRSLRNELLELGVGDAELVRDQEAPEGTKSAEAVTLGSLALVVLPSFLPKLVDYLQSWTQRDENRRVKVKTQVGDRSIELDYLPSALSDKELTHLVETLTGAMGKRDAG
jgi:hypothetical protein